MSKQPRDVTGGEEAWGAMIPGLGLINYIWGILTVPMEVFLRRNFGERWFTQANFFGGLIILLLIQFVAYVIGLFNPFGMLAMLFGRSGASVESWMGPITKWYVFVGILHFLRIWWNDIIGTPVHSFWAGKSWLRPIGRVVMFVLNLFLNNIVRLIFAMNRRLEKGRLDCALPVISDVDTFTEKWIEPAFVMFLALFAAGAGQTTVSFWLLSSAMALNMYNGIRHQYQRGRTLDFIDAKIEVDYLKEDANTKKKQRPSSYGKMLKRFAYEAERDPEMLKVIEGRNPSLADAIRAMHANQQKNTEVTATMPG